MSDIREIATLAQGKLRARMERERFKTDPGAWAEYKLGYTMWSKQREMGQSIIDNPQTMVAAGHGLGKVVASKCPLPTPSGFINAEDVKVGDLLYDENGDVTKVTGVTEVWDRPEYRVTFDDGTYIDVGPEHEWTVLDLTKRSRKDGTKGSVPDWRDYWHTAVTHETQYLAANLKTSANQNRWRIPLSKPLVAPEADLPIDPYVLGFWLADGSSSGGSVSYGVSKIGVIEEINRRGYTTTRSGLVEGTTHDSVTVHGLQTQLRSLGLLGNKHIPMEYLRSSEEQRRLLLAGILDGDGFLVTRGMVGVDFTDKRLSDDLMDLLWSLGLKPYRKEGVAAYTLDGVRHETGTRYRINFRPLENPFRNRHTEYVPGDAQRSRHTQRTIVSIEPTGGRVQNFCITVDSERHLYLAGRQMVPTHNSMGLAALACWWVDTHWDEDVFLATTAPSASQVGIIWTYIQKFHALSRHRYEEGIIDSAMPGYVTASNQWKTDSGIIVGEGRKPPDRNVDSAFQGRHADYLLALIDEAVGVPKGFIDAIGNMATAVNNRQIMIANPTDLTSEMYRLWEASENGKANWHRLTMSVFDSPRMVSDPYLSHEDARGMSGPEFVERAKTTYGEDSPAYLARVKGEWAQDTGDTVYTAQDVAKAHNTVVVPWSSSTPHLGCDVARMGEDLSVVYKVERGEVWETDELTGKKIRATGVEGIRLRRVDSWSKAPITNGPPDNPDTTSRIHQIAGQLGATVVKVDASGIGASVIDGLAGYDKSYDVVEIYAGSTSIDNPKSYRNLRAEMAFTLKYDIQRGIVDLDPEDTELTEELSIIQYERTESDLFKLESKDDMRRRGVKSPDYFDAMQYAYVNVDHLYEEDMDRGYLELDEDEFDIGVLM